MLIFVKIYLSGAILTTVVAYVFTYFFTEYKYEHASRSVDRQLEQRDSADEVLTALGESSSERDGAQRGANQAGAPESPDYSRAAPRSIERAEGQYEYGLTLFAVGKESRERAKIMDAITAFRAALSARPRERAPLEWAAIQHKLGNALLALAEQTHVSMQLEEAILVYREALAERTHERAPLDWAATQYNLGNALYDLGNILIECDEPVDGISKLNEAVLAYQAALTEWTRERTPREWAATQNNLRNTFSILAEYEDFGPYFSQSAIANSNSQAAIKNSNSSVA